MHKIKTGFTLIEMLVVALMIGILAAIALPQYQYVVYKARYMQLMTLVDSIVRAQEYHFLATGDYTMNLDDLDISLPSDEVSKTDTSRNYKRFRIYILGEQHQVAIGSIPMGTYALSYYHYYKRKDTGLKWRPQCRCSPEGASNEGCRICQKLGGVYQGTNESYTTYSMY